MRDRAVEHFLGLAAARGRLLHGSTVYLDAGARTAIGWLGGIRFLLGLGVRNVLALEDPADEQSSTPVAPSGSMAGRVRQRSASGIKSGAARSKEAGQG